jgi:hypothetical protein
MSTRPHTNLFTQVDSTKDPDFFIRFMDHAQKPPARAPNVNSSIVSDDKPGVALTVPLSRRRRRDSTPNA